MKIIERRIEGIVDYMPENKDYFEPIKSGARPILWYESKNKSTSCILTFRDKLNEILVGEKLFSEILILNSDVLGEEFKIGGIINWGTTTRKLGTITIVSIQPD